MGPARQTHRNASATSLCRRITSSTVVTLSKSHAQGWLFLQRGPIIIHPCPEGQQALPQLTGNNYRAAHLPAVQNSSWYIPEAPTAPLIVGDVSHPDSHALAQSSIPLPSEAGPAQDSTSMQGRWGGSGGHGSGCGKEPIKKSLFNTWQISLPQE